MSGGGSSQTPESIGGWRARVFSRGISSPKAQGHRGRSAPPALRCDVRKPILALLASAAVLAGNAPVSRADDASATDTVSDWSFTTAPYAWAASLKGTSAAFPGLPPVEVDASFTDVLRNLDIGVMTLLELRYRRFAGYADVIYTHVSADAETPKGLLFDSIDAESGVFIGTFGGAYRVVEDEGGFLDLSAGARVWSVDTEVKLDGGLLADRDLSHSESWADPVIGVKGRFNLGEGFFLNGLAHVGGFDVASDLTWDVFGGVGYQFNDTVSAVAGYRHLEVDYEDGGFIFDVQMSGPVIGAVIRF